MLSFSPMCDIELHVFACIGVVIFVEAPERSYDAHACNGVFYSLNLSLKT